MHRWAPFQPPRPVVHPVRPDPSGRAGPTRGQARGRTWRAVGNGFVVPADTPLTAEQRIAEATALLGVGGAVTGWAALLLYGAAFLDGRFLDGTGLAQAPVPLVTRQARRPRPGVVFLQHRTPPPVVVHGIPCTPLRWAVLDALRLAPDLREAVVAMDMVAAARLLSVERMVRFLDSRTWRGVPGIPQARAALSLADEGSASPPESRLRWVWRVEAGLPPVLVNQPVFDRGGRLLGVPDLFDVEAGLAVEYDGDDHRAARRHSDDVDREARFRAHRVEVTRVTGRDLRRTDALVDRLVQARGRALFLPQRQRLWTLEPPPWHAEELPLDVELDLRGEGP